MLEEGGHAAGGRVAGGLVAVEDQRFRGRDKAAHHLPLRPILVIVDDFPPLQSCLRPGERLLWRGQPDPKVRFTAADLHLIPISILWCGFAMRYA